MAKSDVSSGFVSSSSSPIVVATDGNEQSDGAVRAGALLGASAAAWHIISAAPVLHDYAPELKLAVHAEALEVLREQQRTLVHDQIRRVLGKDTTILAEIVT